MNFIKTALIVVILSVFHFEALDGQSALPTKPPDTCPLGLPPGESSPGSYPLASSFLHIFTWMKVACEGQVTSVSFINRQTSPNAIGRFYLGVFEAVPFRETTFRLDNYIPVDLQSLDIGWQTANFTDPRTLMTVKTGQYFGYFYERYTIAQQSQLILPYKLSSTPEEAELFKTYVGRISLAEMNNDLELTAPTLLPHPTGRIVALSVTITKTKRDGVSCGEPLTIAKGRIVARSSNGLQFSGDYVHYECIDGYAIEGDQFWSRCGSDGQWSTLPSCVATCGKVPNIPNTEIISKSFATASSRVGDTVDYACLPGYVVAQNRNLRITCLAPSKWSQVPFCIADSSPTTTSATETATPLNSVTCGFEPAVNFALAVERNFRGANSRPLSQVRYQCDPGYQITSGSDLVICGDNGLWGNLPVCSRIPPGATTTTSANTVTCPIPPGIANGRLVDTSYGQNNPTPGAIAIYGCNSGYVISNVRDILCRPDGTWSPLPACTLATASSNNPNPGGPTTTANPVNPNPGGPTTTPDPTNSNPTGNGNNGNTLTTATRQTNSNSNGQPTTTPSWTPSSCGNPPVLQNGQLAGVSQDGTRATYVCNNGYTMSGSNLVQCQTNTWSQMPTCNQPTTTPIDQSFSPCGSPPSVANGRETARIKPNLGTSGGEVVTYECLSGFTMTGQNQITCQTNPLGWTNIPSCTRDLTVTPDPNFQTQCGPPQTISNAEIYTTHDPTPGVPGGEIVTYTCNTGYSMAGSNTMTCLPDLFVWSTTPRCVQQQTTTAGPTNPAPVETTRQWPVGTCGNPPAIQNGNIFDVNIDGSRAAYNCNSGYVASGSNLIQCDPVSRSWSTPPTCVPDATTTAAPVRPTINPNFRSACGSPPNVLNGYVVSTSTSGGTRGGETITYACNNGFLMTGANIVACLSSELVWTSPPTCSQPTTTTPVSNLQSPCGQPPTVNNAVITSLVNTQPGVPGGEVVTYTCNSGYSISGSGNSATCLTNPLGWTNAPTCIRDSVTPTSVPTFTTACGSPPNVVNGRILTQAKPNPGVAGGEIVTYACNSGYTLTGFNEVTCRTQPLGWTTAPTCVIEANPTASTNFQSICGWPPVVSNAEIESTSNPNPGVAGGEVVTYRCNSGFNFAGFRSVRCLTDPLGWSVTPTCLGQAPPTTDPNFTSACGQVPEVRYGVIVSQSQPNPGGTGGEVVTYRCNNRFTLDGSETITCQTNPLGWTAIPRCVPPASCGPARVLTNGEIASQDFAGSDSSTGSVVRYRCVGIYVIQGSDTVTCQQSGHWTNMPTCGFENCGPFPTVDNALIESQSFTGVIGNAGDTVKYRCRNDRGRLIMVGSNTITCDAKSLRWTAPPVCSGSTSSCGPSPGVRNGAISSSSISRESAIGDFTFYKCDEGFTMQGEPYVSCNNETWSTPPTCIASCGNAPDIANAIVASKTFADAANPGDMVEYQCAEGFRFVEGSLLLVRCLPTMRWSTPFPQCISNGAQSAPIPPTSPNKPAKCGDPPQIANAQVIQQTEFAVRFLCVGNYVIKNMDTSACQSDLSWWPIPECIRSCGVAPTVPNAVVTWQSFNGTASPPSAVARYACSNGQLIDGPDSVSCGEDGQWSQTPSCMTCGLPPEVPNARVDFQTFKSDASQPGSVARYACQLGMRVRGTDTVICGVNGQWSVAPICIPNSCGTIPNVANSVIDSQSFSGTNGGANDVVIFSCRTDRGYFVLKGNATVTCDPTRFQWSPAPFCDGDINSCGTVPPVRYGFVAASSVETGAISQGQDFIFYSCNGGFVLNGEDLVQCKSGHWTELPTCIPSCGTNGPGVPNAVIVNKSFNSYAVIGDIVEYTCLSGYTLSPGSQTKITCLATWRWSQLPRCGLLIEPVVRTTPRPPPAPVVNTGLSRCGPVPEITDGYVTTLTLANNVTDFLDTVEYACNSTTRMIGLNIIFCQSNNLWSTPPRCLSATTASAIATTTAAPVSGCPVPPLTISNGRLLSRSFEAISKINDIISYKCNQNYVLSGPTRIVCQDTGTWSEMPTCIPDTRLSSDVPIMCNFPPTLLNGRVNDTSMGSSGQLEISDYILYACDSGFEIVGQSRVWCQGSTNGVSWGPIPTCRSIGDGVSCGRAPTVPFGNRVRFDYQRGDPGANMALPGDKVYYSCFDGYVLIGSSVIQCLAGPPVAWETSPICSDKTCGRAPGLTNGRIVTANFVSGNARFGGPGDTLYYTCNQDYVIIGPETVTCSGNPPQWSFMPTCERGSSGNTLNFPAGRDNNAIQVQTKPPTPSSTTPVPVVLNDSPFNAPGLILDAPSGTCGPLPVVENALMLSSVDPNSPSFQVSTSIQYSCNSGFSLAVDSIDTMICTPQGWSSKPVCRKDVNSQISFGPCSQPPAIDNGFISDINGATVMYLCKLGYTLADQSLNSVTCTSDGSWSTPPKCTAAGCGPAPQIANAHLTVKTFDTSSIPDDKAFYQCNEGYQVDETPYIVITCLVVGAWTQGGTCVPLGGFSSAQANPDTATCGTTPSLDNGRIIYTQYISGTPARGGLGDTIFYACDEGFLMTGDRQVVCSSTPLQWSKLPTCTPASSCLSLPVVSNGYVHSQTISGPRAAIGDQVIFQCPEGWNMEGSAIVTCTSNGWSLAPRCVRQAASTCGRAPTVDNGVIIYADFANAFSEIGSRAFYRCNEGYIVNAVPSSVICQESGTWSVAPKCLRTAEVRPVQCSAPPLVANGDIIYKSYETMPAVGSLVMYDCNMGYSLTTRNNYVQCAAQGRWTEEPRCERQLSCGPAPTIPNGRITGKTFSENAGQQEDRVYYSCNSGFTMGTGAMFITCNNASWSTLPICSRQLTACNNLPNVDNSRIVYSSRKEEVAKEGDVIWLSCTAGFEINGKEVVTCLSNGTWSTLPTCVPASANCNSPPAISNGIIYERSYQPPVRAVAGDFVRYRCNGGFTRNTANDDAVCSADGTWTTPPQCLDHVSGCGSPPGVENAKVVFSSSVGNQAVTNDVVWYECFTGFELEGSNAIRCLPSGAWSPSPRCRFQLTDTCGAPPPINRGFISQPYHGPSATGSRVAYACNSGYKLIGAAQITCLSSGKWSAVPRCEAAVSQVSCGRVPEVRNGKAIESNFVGSDSDVTSYVIYACNSGYVLRGLTRIECLGSGGWTQPPQCEPRPTTGTTCGPVPVVTNAVVVYNTVPANNNFSIVGDIVWYQCLEGYQPSSYPGIQCASKGWTGQPECRPIKRHRCSSSMSMLFALDLQESDTFSRQELQSVVSFLKALPVQFHKITDMKTSSVPDTVIFSTGGVTLTGIQSREYVSKSITVADSQDNSATLAEWDQWIDGNVGEFKHALNDDLAKLLQTIRNSLIPTLPVDASKYNESLRIVYLTTARRGTSLVEAQGEATALQLLGGRIFVMAVGDALSALSQHNALRQQVASDISYFRYFSTAKQLSVDSLASDAAFQSFFCGPSK